MYITNDSDLIKSCLVGDETAWEELVERYHQLVYSIPCHFGFATVETEAIFQETFSIFLSHLAQVQHEKSIAGWLITTTYLQCQKNKSKANDSTQLDKALSPDLAKRWENQQKLRIAIAQIDQPCRDLVTSLLSNNASRGKTVTQSDMAQTNIKAEQISCFRRLDQILTTMQFKWE